MTTWRGKGALERALARLRPRRREPLVRYGHGAEIAPDSAFDVQMRERVRGLEDGLKEVKDRVNGLIFLVVGAVVAQVVLRLWGDGSDHPHPDLPP